MKDFLNTYTSELTYTVIAVVLLLIFRFILKTGANKVGKREDINLARIKLMVRYINVLIFVIAVFVLLLVWGVEVSELSLVFSSVFAVLGIALFAIWSILSNITSGIIMFFSFPYKIGDQIKIHDKDAPLEGIIEDIKAFQLHLRTPDGELITYPNNLLLQKAISLVKKDAYNDEGKDAL